MKKILYVKVIPRSSKNIVISDEMDLITSTVRLLKVKVTSIPEKGKANDSVIKVLSEYLKVSKSKIKIISGESSVNKKIEYIED